MKPFALFIHGPGKLRTAVLSTWPAASDAFERFLLRVRGSVAGGLVGSLIDPTNLQRRASFFPLALDPQAAAKQLNCGSPEVDWIECLERTDGFFINVREDSVLQPRETLYKVHAASQCDHCGDWMPLSEMMRLEGGNFVERTCINQYITDTAKFWGIYRTKTQQMLVYDKVLWDDEDALIRKVCHSIVAKHRRIEPEPKYTIDYQLDDAFMEAVQWTTFEKFEGVVVIIHIIEEE